MVGHRKFLGGGLNVLKQLNWATKLEFLEGDRRGEVKLV